MVILRVHHPRVVNRFHATRQMAENCESPTMSSMLDAGLRTTEANKMWQHLNVFTHSAVWVMSGSYVRHARLMRGPLAQRVAQVRRVHGGHKGGGKGKGKNGKNGKCGS